MAIRCSKDDTDIYEITLYGNGYHEIIEITGKEYSKDVLTVDVGSITRPFRITLKKTINKILINKQCHIQIKYPDGKIYGGNGFFDIIKDDLFVMCGYSIRKINFKK